MFTVVSRAWTTKRYIYSGFVSVGKNTLRLLWFRDRGQTKRHAYCGFVSEEQKTVRLLWFRERGQTKNTFTVVS